MQRTASGACIDSEGTDPVLKSIVEVSKESSQEVRGGRGSQRESAHENPGVLFVKRFYLR